MCEMSSSPDIIYIPTWVADSPETTRLHLHVGLLLKGLLFLDFKSLTNHHNYEPTQLIKRSATVNRIL